MIPCVTFLTDAYTGKVLTQAIVVIVRSSPPLVELLSDTLAQRISGRAVFLGHVASYDTKEIYAQLNRELTAEFADTLSNALHKLPSHVSYVPVVFTLDGAGHVVSSATPKYVRAFYGDVLNTLGYHLTNDGLVIPSVFATDASYDVSVHSTVQEMLGAGPPMRLNISELHRRGSRVAYRLKVGYQT